MTIQQAARLMHLYDNDRGEEYHKLLHIFFTDWLVGNITDEEREKLKILRDM